SDVVTIRGLTLNGLGGQDGIRFSSGAALYVQDSVFKNLSNGVDANTSSDARLFVEDSLFTGSANVGVFLEPSVGTLRGTIDRSRFEGGANGVVASQNAEAVIRDSVATG